MPTLFVLSGSLVGRTFEVDGPTVLGRGTDCGVVLADRSVSREHARLEPAGAGWRIVDLGSRNGIKLHGERVEAASLRDLDEITLGELVLRFRTAAAEPASPAAAPRPPEPPPIAPLTRPPPRPAPAPRALEPHGTADFALEEEIELEADPALGAPAAHRPPIELTDRDRERARLLASAPASGFFSGDLSQWPLALRWTAYAAVLAVLCGAFYGAFWLMERIRAG